MFILSILQCVKHCIFHISARTIEHRKQTCNLYGKWNSNFSRCLRIQDFHMSIQSTRNSANTLDISYYKPKKDGNWENRLNSSDSTVPSTSAHPLLSDQPTILERTRSVWSAQTNRNISDVHPVVVSPGKVKANPWTAKGDTLSNKTRNESVPKTKMEQFW